MYNTAKTQDLITAEEAVNLRKYCLADTALKVKEIVSTYQQTVKADTDEVWEFLKLGSLLFEAGRIQGIREERMKRN